MRLESRNSNSNVVHNSYYVSASNLTAHVAYVATLLSPYPVPDNLALVCRKFYEAIVACKFDEIAPEFYHILEPVLFSKVREILFNTPEFVAWNSPKNLKADKNQHELFMVTSRYEDKPHPDDDFIDLDAFIMEYVVTLKKTERN